jgi:hypothetical protein
MQPDVLRRRPGSHRVHFPGAPRQLVHFSRAPRERPASATVADDGTLENISYYDIYAVGTADASVSAQWRTSFA